VVYESLEEAGTLEVTLTGDAPDLDALGFFQVHFQEIIDRVSYWVAIEGGLVPPGRWNSPHIRRLGRAFRLGEPGPLVKGRVVGVSSGSLIQEIGFALAVVVADSDMRAILQNLAANVVWAICNSGIRGVRSCFNNSNINRPNSVRPSNRRDPADIGPNLRAIVLALAESGHTAEIHVKSKVNGKVTQEVEISLSTKEG